MCALYIFYSSGTAFCTATAGLTTLPGISTQVFQLVGAEFRGSLRGERKISRGGNSVSCGIGPSHPSFEEGVKSGGIG